MNTLKWPICVRRPFYPSFFAYCNKGLVHFFVFIMASRGCNWNLLRAPSLIKYSPASGKTQTHPFALGPVHRPSVALSSLTLGLRMHYEHNRTSLNKLNSGLGLRNRQISKCAKDFSLTASMGFPYSDM